MNHWLLALLFAAFVTISRLEELTDCIAGEYFDSTTTTSGACRQCKPRTYSEDASSTGKCESCPKHKKCFCDTTRTEVYAPGGKEVDSYKNCSQNGTLRCSLDCYAAATMAHAGPETGSLQKLATILSCKCKNPKTEESCEKTKKFTKHCFQNECDGGKHYLNNRTDKILSSCYKDHKANKSCGKAQCGALLPYFQDLTTCNCYHYHGQYAQVGRKRHCEAVKEFYVALEKNCKVEIDNFWFIIPVAGALLFFMIIALGRYCAVKYGRHLKESGEIGKIIPYIDWNKIEAFGIAGSAVRSERTANVLSDKEIILKVRFGVMKGCFGGRFVRPQHVVLKIFSESQCEQQGVELGVINSIFNKSQARDCHIISVYGPDSGSSNRDLVRFLELLITKSECCRNLASVIERCYLGATEDQALTSPRCRYIMMNHCNELSLSKFMSHKGFLTLDTVLHICRDLAKALDFLHERNRRGNQHRMIIHCDIKPDNIFVKKRRNTSFIVGDFGLSVALNPGEVFRLKGSTSSFLPPEWFVEMTGGGNYSQVQKQNIESRGNFPCKIDIYQYGLIVWLALHKKSEPWVDEFEKVERRRVNPKIKKHEFLKGLFSDPETFSARPSFAVNTNRVFVRLRTLAERCWQTEVQKRPSACEILSILAHHDRDVNYV